MGYVSYIPYARLSCSVKNGKNSYNIRFSPFATRLIGDVKNVDVLKTNNNKYIVLVPRNELDTKPGVSKLKVYSGCAYLFSTGRVNQQFFQSEWFDGRKVKIKRRKNDNSIWICLEERINDGQGTDDRADQGTGSGD